MKPIVEEIKFISGSKAYAHLSDKSKILVLYRTSDKKYILLPFNLRKSKPLDEIAEITPMTIVH